MSHLDTRIIKASFRENPVEERKLFPFSSCLMPISVGQAIHEGAKFAAVVKLINQSFKQCTILVDDSVQRHTMGILKEVSAEELYHLALFEGDAWIARNESVFQQLDIPYTLMRWDDWYQKPAYIESRMQVQQAYETDPNYRQAIHQNIDDFLTRYLSRVQEEQVNHQRAFDLCLTYLLEECAVMCLWTEGLYDFEVYPSGRNQAMAATYETLIKPKHPQLLRPVALRFKKYPGKTATMTSNEVLSAAY